ncbi:uncharacterized protein LOC129575189 [Sitodiplosis mosellana]|uniref:uncharacterized protein LOC129575189 n=1 Tax=Sitodiplosis mosellana TaxID=263140 RepID=UPI002444BFEC|nr:uncharacterized protein LOC129575189 [Sitodiplosis mosellana]
MSKLEDLLGKKKEVVPVLDLSKQIVNSKEEYKRLFEKVPDYKMRPIKVRPEDIKIKDPDSGLFKPTKKETNYLLRHNGERERQYTYLDPIPAEMRSLKIKELCTVPIDWKMLTTLRPKTKIEEEYYSKLIELGKLQIRTEQRNKREYLLNPAVKKVKNKSGVVEMRPMTCAECSEEYCNGKNCIEFNYDLYTRIVPKDTAKAITTKTSIEKESGGGKKTKKKSKSFDLGKGKKTRNRSKSPNKSKRK